MIDKLKPCPFCGGNAEIITGVSRGVPANSYACVRCKDCDGGTRAFDDVEHNAEFIYKAIQAWNRRTNNEKNSKNCMDD